MDGSIIGSILFATIVAGKVLATNIFPEANMLMRV